MALLTRDTLRTEIRQRADMEDDGNFVSDSELNTYINKSIQDLYDLILASEAGRVYVKNAPILTKVGLFSYSLPADFYELRSACLIEGENIYEYIEVDRGDYAWYANDPPAKERGVYTFGFEQDGSKQLFIFPAPDVDNFAVTYIPEAQQLADDVTTWDGYSGWEDYVVVKSAIKCLQKEESDTTALQFELDTIGKDIQARAGAINAGDPTRVRTRRNRRRRWYK